jgi:hypothetical protein
MHGHNNGYLADKWLVWNIDGGVLYNTRDNDHNDNMFSNGPCRKTTVI